jgi:polysaccharide export outer membrane protein
MNAPLFENQWRNSTQNLTKSRVLHDRIRELAMRCTVVLGVALAAAGAVMAQQQDPMQHSGNNSAQESAEHANLPLARIGADDLLGISVYDSPELTRTIRVDADGAIHLPMVKQLVQAAGLYPAELEKSIARVLIEENVLINPVVTVSVVEYRSKPITVAGAVKTPLVFQATGTVTLLDAISRAGGISDNAGDVILISRPQATGENGASSALVQRVPVHALLSGEDLGLNLLLKGGEEIRVPEAGRVYVVGQVKKPGAYMITDGSESSVLKAVALSDGLDSYPSKQAYIYRKEGGAAGSNAIQVNLKDIMQRKSPDVPLMANDILYIPDATGRRAALTSFERGLLIASGLGTALLVTFH